MFTNIKKRPYLLYVPANYTSKVPIPLWIHAPGTDVQMDTIYQRNYFLADECTFAIVVLSGLWQRMSVSKNAQAGKPNWPDDVAYTRVVLRDVLSKVHVDMRRIRCVGFSRGARFCSRLASELSAFVSAIAAVSGIRFPEPTNASRPMPVIAFHGMDDEVNPYEGGGPKYWGESVRESIWKWANFNGCERKEQRSLTRDDSVQVTKYTGCRNNADVVLVTLRGVGHAWPDLRTINARAAILQFFSDHIGPDECRTVKDGEKEFRHCYQHVQKVRNNLLDAYPELYDGLTNASSFEDFQAEMRHKVYSDCPPPCSPKVKVEAAGELWRKLPVSEAPLVPPHWVGLLGIVPVTLTVVAAMAFACGAVKRALPYGSGLGYSLGYRSIARSCDSTPLYEAASGRI